MACQHLPLAMEVLQRSLSTVCQVSISILITQTRLQLSWLISYDGAMRTLVVGRKYLTQGSRGFMIGEW